MSTPGLIPQPLSLHPIPGGEPFSLAGERSIVVGQRAGPGEWVAARQLLDALRARGCSAPIQPQIRCPSTAGAIVLAVRGRDDEVFPDARTAQLAPRDARLSLAHGGAEGYTLDITAERVALWGAGPAGLARGVQTIRQLLAGSAGSIPALAIADAPAFPWRGIMLDVSRGRVPSLATLHGLVERLASYKLNMLQLYVEHTFAGRRQPRIGQGWGALTPEEIVALDDHCRAHQVELIPCLQSFGHLRRILELPDYAHLAESDQRWSLAPALEETYTFLDDRFADFLACFSSPYLNVCSDETYDLGTGRSADLAAREGLGRLYLGHIKRLHALAAGYGRTIMLWDDIFLHHPDLIAEIPADAILLNWSYEAAEAYPQVSGFRAAGLRQVVCPGTSTWNTLFPRLANARANIRGFIAAGRDVAALGTLTTDWGDGGHPNALGLSWYPYAYAAAESWSPGVLDDAAFEGRFAGLTFGDAEAGPALTAMRALAEACSLPGILRRNGSHSTTLFFDDPLGDERCRAIPDEALGRLAALAAVARSHLGPLQGVDAEAALTLDELRLAADQIAHAAAKTILARRLAAGDVAHHDEGALRALKRDLQRLRREHERLWVARSKPEGLWLTLDRFDRAAQVLDAWLQRLQSGYRWEA